MDAAVAVVAIQEFELPGCVGSAGKGQVTIIWIVTVIRHPVLDEILLAYGQVAESDRRGSISPTIEGMRDIHQPGVGLAVGVVGADEGLATHVTGVSTGKILREIRRGRVKKHAIHGVSVSSGLGGEQGSLGVHVKGR